MSQYSVYDDDSEPADQPRRVGFVRHLGSLVLCLLVTPLGVYMVGEGSHRLIQHQVVQLDSELDVIGTAMLLAGTAVLFFVASLSRMSGLGPLLAGLVWGFAPFVYALVDLRGYLDLLDSLPLEDGYAGLDWFAFGAFPVLGACLVGAGFGGRWRGGR